MKACRNHAHKRVGVENSLSRDEDKSSKISHSTESCGRERPDRSYRSGSQLVVSKGVEIRRRCVQVFGDPFNDFFRRILRREVLHVRGLDQEGADTFFSGCTIWLMVREFPEIIRMDHKRPDTLDLVLSCWFLHFVLLNLLILDSTLKDDNVRDGSAAIVCCEIRHFLLRIGSDLFSVMMGCSRFSLR